jgi:glycosyltransferase involved in cell wall biosynthesis
MRNDVLHASPTHGDSVRERGSQLQRNKMPSVIHVADFGASYAGNFIASLKALGQECQRRGRRSVLVLPPGERDYAWCQALMAAGQAIHFVPPRPTVAAAKALAAIAVEESAEILHCHFTAYDTAAWIAQKRLRLAGRRLAVVWHVHSEIPPAQNLIRRVKNFVKHACLGRSTRIIAVSEHLREQAVAAGCPPARVGTILNGIDVDWATHAARSKTQIACELAIAPGHLLVLMIGWDPLRKGVDTALSAVNDLIAEGFPIVLGIVGKERLSTYLSEHTANTPCPWIRQITPTDDIASLYQAAAVFLSPSRNEGFTYAACEAMANGTPVVLADIPPVAWAHDCPGTVFCQAGDANSLRDALRNILNWSAADREDRTRESSRFVREKFDVRHWAAQVAAFYWGKPSPNTLP